VGNLKIHNKFFIKNLAILVDKVDKIVGGSIEVIKTEFPVISKPTEEVNFFNRNYNF
jgi:hypothetical protein